ncbi:MAG TPA: DUF480 domain-containing protein, partial [Acidimicrobiales bacterium]|nr:DUF480 domain-containing protein [Acidimicrobiales bacterium]
MRFSQEEGRVIGSLIEKQLTTPQQYPLSLNALLLACNQSSNREPVVEFDETTVDNTLALLKTAGLVSYVYPSHGRSVTRYQHLLGEQLALTEQQLALVAVLLLRGPQTGGELRSRTERMCEFDSIAQVDAELERLSARPEPVVELDETTVDNTLALLKTAGLVSYVYPSHGRSVTRYQHLLGEQLALTEQQLALVAVLLLRGPQTGGELRSRTERMCEFDS